MKWLALSLLIAMTPLTAKADRLTADEVKLFVMECEYLIGHRLSAPATYKRVSVTPVDVAPGTLEEFMGIETPEKAHRVAEENRQSLELQSLRMSAAEGFSRGDRERISVTIVYQFTDADGLEWARQSVCHEYIRTGMAWSAFAGGHNVSVDGLTWLEWIMLKGGQPDQ